MSNHGLQPAAVGLPMSRRPEVAPLNRPVARERLLDKSVDDEIAQYNRRQSAYTAADSGKPEVGRLTVRPNVSQPLSNTPIAIDPNNGTSNESSHDAIHSVSEKFVPGFTHHHVFWWMGWDPAAADTRAWEDPFPFVTFDYLPHVATVPETPEP